MKLKIFLTVIIFLILIGALLFFYKRLDDSIFQLFSLIGTIASLFALVIVWIQSAAIKTAADASKEAAFQTKDKIVSFLSSIDITKMIKTVHEIQSYNRQNKFEISIMRMQELREALQRIKNNYKYKSDIEISSYNDLISMLSVDISSIEKFMLQKNTELDVLLINSNLDGILTEISELNAKIRFKGA
jgi:tRNA U34 5-carboxymethylaminomethyl modifying GTPase MnmE/TrmE